jgi:metallo-beta-lactamase class B
MSCCRACASSGPGKCEVRRILAAILFLGLAGPAFAQTTGEEPTKEMLAKNNQLFLTLARQALHWDEPTEPFHMVGPLYYVGTRGLGAFLFVTSEGHILLNTGMPESGELIVASISHLGFKPEDIKLLINGHAHVDHAGAMAYMKGATGAELAVMDGDVAAMEDGGKSDFQYGADWQVMGFPPVDVDRVLRDGERVTLGEVALTALSTPGHTQGSTTWVTELVEDGKVYLVVFPDGAGFNPGYRIMQDPSYPGIEADYRRTHHRLEMLKPDIWATAHPESSAMEEKRERAKTEGLAAWIDPEGYRLFVAKEKLEFEALVNEEMGVTVPE